MRNRAKCKVCLSIIESVNKNDYVECSCGEIAVEGGDSLKCLARDWNNFIRVDDEEKEVIPEIKEKEPIKEPEPRKVPTREDLIEMFNQMIKNIEDLPQHAMTSFVTNYDLYSFMLVISSILRS